MCRCLTVCFSFCSMLFLALFCLGALTGCVCDRDHFGVPDLTHPGYISEQEQRMNRFNPYASSEIGPKIVGDRPSGSTTERTSSQRYQQATQQPQRR